MFLPVILLVGTLAGDGPLVPRLKSPPAPTTYSGIEGQINVRVPRNDADVRTDGRLDEPQWKTAALLTGFSQFSPSDGRPAEDSTQALVWYSQTALHIGIRAFEAHGAVHATLADRDRISADDYVEILLGTFNDQRQATVFGANPLGVQSDGVLVESGQSGGGDFIGSARPSADLSPDFVFQSSGRLTEYGYEVEIRIPFKSLRYQPKHEQQWGINILRRVQHSGYEDSWAPAKRAAASFLAQAGTLDGLTDLRRGLVLDVNPVITSKVSGEPAVAGWHYDADRPEAGANVRWGVTDNVTLNGTINPDFSQVESDAGQVAFDPRQALFFSEKRPFFLDGIEQFSTPNSLIYTRRVQQPIGAVKLTGKVSGTDIAFLSAVDEQITSLTGEDNPVFNILRIQRDLGSQSRLGIAYTDRIDGENYNRVANADARIVFGKIYSTQLQLAGSTTRRGDVKT
ncbi:MAG: carbohydrate binding family 9 domain-containing protein, partial [Gemmatimonadota bacterium]|nr:carbohydrate binding family 9 domain-containing protein [Gemmatimonadota bacterium]